MLNRAVGYDSSNSRSGRGDLWKSAGTAQRTIQVKLGLRPASKPTNVNGTLYVRSDDEASI
jgi:hypothetical protein